MEFHFPRRGQPVADPNCADGKKSSHTGQRRAARSVRVSHRLTPTNDSHDCTKARLVRRRQAFQFLEPVEDDVDPWPYRRIILDHDERFTVRRDVGVGRPIRTLE